MRNTKTKTMVECALMIALATVLGAIPIFELPQGGSITAASMMPLVVISFRHGPKWGLLTSFIFSLIQLMMGFKNVMYCTTFGDMILCALLDYVVAYTLMGLSCVFGKVSKNPTVSVVVGTAVTGLLRYLCSFLSGIIIWEAYVPEGMPVWFYSLTYNGSFMLPELLLTIVASVLVIHVLDRQMPQKTRNAA